MLLQLYTNFFFSIDFFSNSGIKSTYFMTKIREKHKNIYVLRGATSGQAKISITLRADAAVLFCKIKVKPRAPLGLRVVFFVSYFDEICAM